MGTRKFGIIMHGVTGRMGYNQHLVRSILAIRDQGGVVLANGDRLMLDPIIVGRNAEKVEALASEHGIERWSDDLDAALANPDDTIFFDAGTTQMRAGLLARAIDAGKHVYCEKPISDELGRSRWRWRRKAQGGGGQARRGAGQAVPAGPAEARDAARLAASSGGCSRCAASSATGCSRATGSAAQRPSWNYRKADGGGIILDMLCHWRYVLDNLFGEVKAVSCLGATHIPERVDEKGKRLRRRRRRRGLRHLRARGRGDRADQLVLGDAGAPRRSRHVPGGRHARLGGGGADKCWTQHRVNTPKPVWNPDQPQTIDFFDSWDEVPDN